MVTADALENSEIVLARRVEDDFAFDIHLRQVRILRRLAGEGDDELSQFTRNLCSGLAERQGNLALEGRIPRMSMKQPVA